MRIEEPNEGGSEDSDGGKLVTVRAKRALVGAGARVLFYPTLMYNVLRNKIQAEFRWWDEVDQVASVSLKLYGILLWCMVFARNWELWIRFSGLCWDALWFLGSKHCFDYWTSLSWRLLIWWSFYTLYDFALSSFQFILLGAVPFRKDVPRLQQLGVRGVITLNEPYETLVPSSLYKVNLAFYHPYTGQNLCLYNPLITSLPNTVPFEVHFLIQYFLFVFSHMACI